MKNTQRRGIRQFIALWLGAVLLSFGLMGGGLLLAVPRLAAKTQGVYEGSRALDQSHRFELALVAQGRDESLWHLSGEARYQRDKALRLRQADDLLAAIKRGAQAAPDAPESRLVARIAGAYRPVRLLALSPLHDTPRMQAALDRLLKLVQEHRDLNARQMEASVRAGSRLDGMIDRWILGLLLLATGLLLAGSLMLWTRLFTPVLRLARAVRDFGGGDLQARAPLLRHDEMGELCQAFNVMAEAISERERDRLRFVATVAHDLRNPLVVIGGAAHLLQHKEMRLSNEERFEWLGRIQKQTFKLEAMIGDLTDGVQAHSGQLAFEMAEFDLSALAREVAGEYAASAQTHLVRLDIAASCPVSGDRKRLERVLMNLMSNAIKYSPSGSEVNVSLHLDGPHALLRVRDEGAGIAPEDLPRLFLPFSRLESTKKMASGTGLGLSSARKIVEGHGGEVRVRSEPGQGTTFEVSLPLLRPGDAPLPESSLTFLPASSQTRLAP